MDKYEIKQHQLKIRYRRNGEGYSTIDGKKVYAKQPKLGPFDIGPGDFTEVIKILQR